MKMKKWILLVVIIGMLGWAVIDFMDSNENAANPIDNGEDVNDKETENDSNENNQDTENENGAEPPVGLDIGNKAPDFQLETLTGDIARLSEFQGSRVMINFWATWCPPCRAEMPDMQQFHQDKDVVILAINLADTEKSKDDIEKFADEYGITFPILLDEDLEVSNLYAIQPIPTTFMVDSEGIIQYKAFGAMNYDFMVQEFEKMN